MVLGLNHFLDPYPKGWQNPQVARVSGILSAQGAWDTTPLELLCDYANVLSIELTYTRGAAGGAVDVMVQTSLYSGVALVPTGALEWEDFSIEAPGMVVPGADTQTHIQADYYTFTSLGAAIDTITIGPIVLGGLYERIRFYARESGDDGDPGICQITIQLM